MSYETKRRVIEDVCITENTPGRKHYPGYPNKVPNDLTITFSCRGTFEVTITDGYYEVEKIGDHYGT